MNFIQGLLSNLRLRPIPYEDLIIRKSLLKGSVGLPIDLMFVFGYPQTIQLSAACLQRAVHSPYNSHEGVPRPKKTGIVRFAAVRKSRGKV